MAFPILALIPVIGKLLDKLIPDPVAAAKAQHDLLKLAQDGELAWLDADVKLAVGQMEINKVEAASPGIFKGGWRPAAGWGCVIIGVFYPFVRVVLPWVLTVAGVQGVPALPALDTGEQMAMLSGMLGLGGMRMAERLKGKA